MRKPRAINPWSVFSEVLVSLHRTIAFIDGFNLYHAIASLRRPELKWVNLKTLAAIFINTSIEQLEQALFPAFVGDLTGLSVNCPKEYTGQAIYAET